MPQTRDRLRAGLWKASLTGVAVIMLSDVGYRLASARYAQITSSTPIPEGTLEEIPVKIGDWTGRDVPLDPTIIQYTDTDDRLHRRYVRGVDALTLYVAYGVRIRDLAPHRPEVCYTGSGWNLEGQKSAELQTATNALLPVQIQTFRRGEFESEQVTVLSYYLVNGVYSADVSGLRREVWRLNATDSYSAQIQIVSQGPFEHAGNIVSAFAAESASAIRSMIMEAVKRSQSRR